MCRGHVSGTDWMLSELQARYAGFFSPYIARRIERIETAARLLTTSHLGVSAA
jgi:hypothetical protein